MSTFHHDKAIMASEKQLPEIINFYNKSEAGVDTLGQLVGNYTTKHKTNRWPYALLCNVINVSAVNLYVWWLEVNSDWNANKKYKRRLTLEELGLSLVNPETLRRTKITRGDPSRLVKALYKSSISDSIANFAIRKSRHSKAQVNFWS